MFCDRVAPWIFAAFLLLACGDSNLGTPGSSLVISTNDGGSSGGGTKSNLASGQCPTLGATVCSNDPGASQSDVDTCNSDLSDPNCGSEFKAYLECAGKNVTCDSTGKTDSTAVQTACSQEIQSFSTCESLNTTDGG